MKSLKRQNGLTLIEVLVTLLIMSVGLMGLAGIQRKAISDGLDIAKQSQTTFLATELVDRIRANPDGAANYATTMLAAGCGGAPANCSDTNSGDGDRCTAQQMAAYDLWEVFCGQPAPDGVMANAVDPLDLTQVSVFSANNQYTVEISWDSEQVQNSTLMDDSQQTGQQTRRIRLNAYP